jgi:hypothetical protein
VLGSILGGSNNDDEIPSYLPPYRPHVTYYTLAFVSCILFVKERKVARLENRTNAVGGNSPVLLSARLYILYMYIYMYKVIFIFFCGNAP